MRVKLKINSKIPRNEFIEPTLTKSGTLLKYNMENKQKTDFTTTIHEDLSKAKQR